MDTDDFGHDDLVQRLHDLGAAPLDEALASSHLAAMHADAETAPRHWRRLAVAGAATVALFAGSTGLAAAGILPGPAQGLAHDALGVVGLDVPDQGRGECVRAVAQAEDPPPSEGHGERVDQAASEECAPAERPGAGGDDSDVDAADRPDDVPQGPPEGVPQGPPAGVPAGPPADTPQGPPAATPAGPPAGVPGGPPATPRRGHRPRLPAVAPEPAALLWQRRPVAFDTQSPVPRVTGGREDLPPRPRPLDGSEIDVAEAYRELAPRVLGYLRGAAAPDPENVLGEVFLSVVRRVDDFTGDDASFRRWVFSIAHNRMVDAHRQRKRRPLVAVSGLPEAHATSTDPVDPTLVAALGQLPPDQRTVVVLRFVADLPLADVATVVDRSTEAVKKLQQRGLANLRRALDEDTLQA